jgi:uncharacterized membrane protein YfcA
VRAVLLFVLAFPLALYVRPLRHDWRGGLVMLATVLVAVFVAALVAFPLQPYLPDIDALDLCGSIAAACGIFVGRFLALRLRTSDSGRKRRVH